MWSKSISLVTREVPQEQVWQALTDIASWPQWDKDIQSTKIDVPLAVGASFELKPKGGPTVRLTVSQLEPLSIFADVSHLPLAKMYTTHSLRSTPVGVEIKVEVAIDGLLGFLWRKLIGEKQAAGLLAQTHQLIQYAKTNK